MPRLFHSSFRDSRKPQSVSIDILNKSNARPLANLDTDMLAEKIADDIKNGN